MIPIKDNIPTDRFPLVTVALILANVIVYLLSIRHGGSLISGPDTQEIVKYGATPYALTHPGVHCGLIGPTELGCGRGVSGLPAWETVFTAMFMHASILHLAGNMLFLWIFGNTVEDAMGPIRFIVFYLLGGVAALALQVAVGPNSDGAHGRRRRERSRRCWAATSCSIPGHGSSPWCSSSSSSA